MKGRIDGSFSVDLCNTLGGLGESGVTVFTALLLVMHRLRSDLDPSTRYISEYAVGPCGSLMVVAFGALSVSAGAACAALAAGRACIPRSLVGSTLLGGFSMCMLAVAGFPTDLSTPGSMITRKGRVHNAAARYAIRLVVPGMFVVSHACGRDSRWAGLRASGLVLTTLAAVLGRSIGRRPVRDRPGLVQRAFFGSLVMWLGMLAHRLRTLPEH